MAQIPNASDPHGPPNDVRGSRLATFWGKHLVALGGTRIPLNAKGQPEGDPEFFACSGFVMSFRDDWFFVTAGHVLQGIDEALESGKYRFVSFQLADFFGPGARVLMPTPFDYEGTPRIYVDEEGLDFGLMPLRPLYRAGVAANGVRPITEENWSNQPIESLTNFALLGLPAELITSERQPAGEGMERVVASVQPILLPIQRLEEPPEGTDPTTYPRFVGRVGAGPDVPGMSGGPIIGYRMTEDGGAIYWVVAMQSSWLKTRRIIFGCPVPVFARLVESALDAAYRSAEPQQ